jgi:hypothetical protein
MDTLRTSRDYFDFFEPQLASSTPQELVCRFNQAVGLRSFGIARSGYLWALRHHLVRSGIDVENITTDGVVWSFAHQVELKNGKLYKKS